MKDRCACRLVRNLSKGKVDEGAKQASLIVINRAARSSVLIKIRKPPGPQIICGPGGFPALKLSKLLNVLIHADDIQRTSCFKPLNLLFVISMVYTEGFSIPICMM